MLTVIIPAYNEEKRIAKTLQLIDKELSAGSLPYEILVVNDGSRDKTKEVVKSLENGHIRLLSYDENKGKGGAVSYGVKFAAGQFIIFTDADLAYSPKNIYKAVKLLSEGADVVIGNRQGEKGGKEYPWHRKMMSFGFNSFVKMNLGLKEKDTQCGFKGFRYNAAQSIFEKMQLSGWGFDVEMLFIAEKLGYKIKSLPVLLNHNEKGSKVKVFKSSLDMAKEVMQVKKNNKAGLY